MDTTPQDSSRLDTRALSRRSLLSFAGAGAITTALALAQLGR